MATCDITKGRSKACKVHLGGASKLYLFNFLADPFTIVSGQATAMNVLLTEALEYDLVGDGQILAENGVGSDAAGTFVNTQTTTAILQGLDFPTSNEMKLVANSKPQGIIKTRDGAYLLIGDTEGINFNIDTTTGSAHADFTGYTLVGESKENKYAPQLDAATITTFLAVVTVNV